jgi:hypothetical protein
MKQMAVYGRVLPERANVNLNPGPIPLICEATETCPAFKLFVSIQLSQITVVGNWPNEHMNLRTFRNQVDSTLRLILDSLGFTNRCGYDLELTSAVEVETGVQTVFGVDEPFEISPDLPQFASIFLAPGKVLPLRLALGDLREAIRDPQQTAFFAYRAIESVRQHFSSDPIGGGMRSATHF